jgi:hypothetical protein
MFENTEINSITVLGKTFNSEEERRTYFREELRKYLPELKEHPAQWARDAHSYVIPETGEKSKYPIPWAVICGNILHPLTLKYHEQIDQDVPYPDCVNYQ